MASSIECVVETSTYTNENLASPASYMCVEEVETCTSNANSTTLQCAMSDLQLLHAQFEVQLSKNVELLQRPLNALELAVQCVNPRVIEFQLYLQHYAQ